MEAAKPGNTQKVVLWITIGCLSLLVCGIVGIVSGVGGLAWIGSQSPQNVNIDLNTPVEVLAGESLTFEISITNVGTESVVLNSIDISTNYLGGFQVLETDPPYIEATQYDALGGGETFQTYYFQIPISAGENLTIVFHAQALTEGDFSGLVDVCIDSEINCESDIARTIVK